MADEAQDCAMSRNDLAAKLEYSLVEHNLLQVSIREKESEIGRHKQRCMVLELEIERIREELETQPETNSEQYHQDDAHKNEENEQVDETRREVATADDVELTRTGEANSHTFVTQDAQIVHPKFFGCVVFHNEQWVEICCGLCNANTPKDQPQDGVTFWRGFNDVQKHILKTHMPQFKLEDAFDYCTIVRTVCATDIRRMRHGRPPRFLLLQKYPEENSLELPFGAPTVQPERVRSARNKCPLVAGSEHAPESEDGQDVNENCAVRKKPKLDEDFGADSIALFSGAPREEEAFQGQE